MKLARRVVDSAIYHATRLVAPRVRPHLAPLLADERYVSFSFDDMPRSATTAGARILEDHGVRGTYYAAMSFLRESPGADEGFSREDLLRITAAGHELGCHTYSHLDCLPARAPHILADVARNAAAVRAAVPGVELTSFAFPFGRLMPFHKDLLGARFSSLRSIFPGIHQQSVDLRLLYGNKLYSGGAFVDVALSLIDRVGREGGWAVFFTHDVSDFPTPFGTTPHDLERVVRHALQRDTKVLPVGEIVAQMARPSLA